MRLDNKARMNTPGRAEDNWHWRMGGGLWSGLDKDAVQLRALVRLTNRGW